MYIYIYILQCWISNVDQLAACGNTRQLCRAHGAVSDDSALGFGGHVERCPAGVVPPRALQLLQRRPWPEPRAAGTPVCNITTFRRLTRQNCAL